MSSVSMPADKTIASVGPSAWWLAAGVFTLAVAVYFQTWRELWPFWMDTDSRRYTHGLLIAAVAAWLAWRARPRLDAISLRPAAWAIPVTLLASLAWLVLARAGIVTLHAALWPALAAVGLLAACGWRVMAALAFPLGYLWFAMPLWDHVNRLLQTLTVLAVDAMNRLTDVPGVVVGDTVLIPQGRFEIAAGCSGLHFFVVALAIAALAGEVHRDRFGTRLLLLFIAAALALVTNWLRVYLIILAGYLTDMQHYLVTVDHYRFGWVLFAAAMVVFLLVLRRLPAPPEGSAEARSAEPPRGWRRGYAAGVVALCILPAASLAAHWLDRSPDDGAFVASPVGGFVGPLSPSPVWQPRFTGATAEVRVAYLSPTGRVVDYYGNRYLEQSQGRELIGHGNVLVDPGAFEVIQQNRVAHAVDSHELSVVEVTAELRGGQRWLVMYHYEVGGTRLVNTLATQLTTGYRSLWGSTPAEIHAAAAPCGRDCDLARGELAMLLARMSRNDT